MNEKITMQEKQSFPKEFPMQNYLTAKDGLAKASDWLVDVRGVEYAKFPFQSLEEITEKLQDGQEVFATCTDERSIDETTLEASEKDKTAVRFPGGAAGFAHAIEAVLKDTGVELSRDQIMKTAEKHGMKLYNHMDNVHGSEDHKVGCGYLGLLEMDEAEAVFGRKIANVHEYIKEMETTLNVPTVTLKNEHVAQNGGLFINLYADRALEPEKTENAFFSLDLGLVSQRLELIGKDLGLTKDQQEQVLVNLTRDNMAACYVLSNGHIDANEFAVIGSEQHPELKKVVEKAYAQLTEEGRMEAMNGMISKRTGGK